MTDRHDYTREDFGLLVRLALHEYAVHHGPVKIAHDEMADLAEQLRVCSPKESRTR